MTHRFHKSISSKNQDQTTYYLLHSMLQRQQKVDYEKSGRQSREHEMDLDSCDNSEECEIHH